MDGPKLIFSSTFRRKKVELLSSLQRLGWLSFWLSFRLSFRLSFLSESVSQNFIKGIHLKLGILVHYQKREPIPTRQMTL